MSRWTNADFDAAADQISQAFSTGQGNGGAALNELAVKCARDNTLNPEQIARLCRLVNTRTFETKLAGMQGDKYVQFPVADADAVTSSLCNSASMKTASLADPYPLLEDSLASLRETPEPEQMKLAAAYANAERVCKALPTEAPDKLHRRAKAAVERHTAAAEQAEAEWANALRMIVEKTAGIRWDHDAFEKAALVHTNGAGLYELNTIRETLGREALDVPSDKMAFLIDRIDAAETPAAKLVKVATAARLKCVEHIKQAKIATIERDVRWAETLAAMSGA